MTLCEFGAGLSQTVRKCFAALLCLAVSIAGQAAVNAPGADDEALTAAKVFARLPLEVSDMIRQSTRLDMLDYYTQADSILAANNALGGESRLVQVAPDYLKVQVSPVSVLEIKLLQSGRKRIVMTLYTTGDESMARDTEVRFFDSDLKPLDAGKFLQAPKLTEFFTLKGSGLRVEDLMEKVPFMAVEYTAGPGDSPLKASLTTLRVISEEDSELLTAIMTPAITAPWKGKFDFK